MLIEHSVQVQNSNFSHASCDNYNGRAILKYCSPCSSEDRALASEARCGRSNRPRGAMLVPFFARARLTKSGRGPAVGRMVWDHEVVSSILTAPTIFNYIG